MYLLKEKFEKLLIRSIFVFFQFFNVYFLDRFVNDENSMSTSFLAHYCPEFPPSIIDVGYPYCDRPEHALHEPQDEGVVVALSSAPSSAGPDLSKLFMFFWFYCVMLLPTQYRVRNWIILGI